MNGTVWTVAATAIGAGVMLYGAVGRAVPDSAAPATQSAGSILSQLAPFAGLLLFIGVMVTLLSLALDL
jgi:hypothetical protein